MMRKLLEAFFRHKLLLLLPPILIPMIVGPVAWLITPPTYNTTVSVWVDRPTFLSYNDPNAGNPWVTPSANEVGRLDELLQTRSFQLDIARRTSLSPLIGSASGETRIQTLLARVLTVGRVGDHVLAVQVQAPTAQLAYELGGAVVDAYQEKSAADRADQASVAVSFYESRVQDAQQQLTKSGQDLSRYVSTQAANSDGPSLSDSSIVNLPAATALDPRLSALQANLVSAQAGFDTARKALTQAQQDSSAAVEGQQLGFQVLDPAVLPTTATRQIKKIVIYPIAALAAGLILSAVLLVLLVAGDRSVRSETDLWPGLRVLGVVPAMKLKHAHKNLGAVATRRAIGAAAGAALPVPSGAK